LGDFGQNVVFLEYLCDNSFQLFPQLDKAVASSADVGSVPVASVSMFVVLRIEEVAMQMVSSGMFHRVALVSTDVSEELSASVSHRFLSP
jgi:hypothetical protein